MVTLIKYWGQGKGSEINSISVVHFLEATAKIYIYHRFIIVNLSCVNLLSALYRFNDELIFLVWGLTDLHISDKQTKYFEVRVHNFVKGTHFPFQKIFPQAFSNAISSIWGSAHGWLVPITLGNYSFCKRCKAAALLSAICRFIWNPGSSLPLLELNK